jgi:hypothetical protein
MHGKKNACNGGRRMQDPSFSPEYSTSKIHVPNARSDAIFTRCSKRSQSTVAATSLVSLFVSPKKHMRTPKILVTHACDCFCSLNRRSWASVPVPYCPACTQIFGPATALHVLRRDRGCSSQQNNKSTIHAMMGRWVKSVN